MTELKLTQKQQETVTAILSLRKLTKESGMITTRSQSEILRALNPIDLITVANALAKSI
jgi:hypothetical protein